MTVIQHLVICLNYVDVCASICLFVGFVCQQDYLQSSEMSERVVQKTVYYISELSKIFHLIKIAKYGSVLIRTYSMKLSNAPSPIVYSLVCRMHDIVSPGGG